MTSLGLEKLFRPPTVDDVALLAGVSTATVSRVLNDAAHVTPAVRDRVMDAVQELNYRPNKYARGLAGNRLDGIGVLVPDFTDPYHGELLQVIERTARRHKLQTVVVSGGRTLEGEREALRFLHDRLYDTVIFTWSMLPPHELSDFIQAGLAAFFVGIKMPGAAGRSVFLDHEIGGQMATEHLLARGHKRIAHLAMPALGGRKNGAKSRFKGYRSALEKAGIAFDEQLVIQANSLDEAGGFYATKALLHRKQDFTAIFVATDRLAIGAYQAFNYFGVHIPNDVSVIAYDGLAIRSFMQPKLTTVRQPIAEMGERAANLAADHIYGTTRSEKLELLQPVLSVGDSVSEVGDMSP